jgi:hypothetical protein
MRLVKSLGSLGITVASLLFSLSAQAAPITYIYDGFGTGTLGGSPFTDAAFTITASADTDNITVWPNGGYIPQNTHLSTVIDIAGLGSFSITTPSHSWMLGSGGGSGGLGRNLSLNWLTLTEPALIGYGLDTSIGPVLENSPLHASQFRDVATTGGTLAFSSITEVTFTAAPEPSTLIFLLTLGALGVVPLAWRRRKRHGS